LNPKSPSILAGIVIALAVAAMAAVSLDWVIGRPNPSSEEFQRLTGGLGMGPSLVFSRCKFNFDPRMNDACEEALWPIPGGIYFCSHHACSVFDLLWTTAEQDLKP
tara:strand:+ start:108 stop:425 length:318 start_codon:yes stop_codon:yes gene_type:complete